VAALKAGKLRKNSAPTDRLPFLGTWPELDFPWYCFAISETCQTRTSQYKKVVFKEDRVPKGRSLAVIIEILQTAKRNRTEVSDLAVIEFAYKLVENRIMNEEWGHCEKSAKSISFRSLPPLGEPTRKEGDLIAWVVEEATL
jgi:hypothetical protein